MRCALLEPGSPRWLSILADAAHDFYHLPGYVRLSARVEEGEAHALLVSDARRELLLPLVIRPTALGSRDATSPYGYPGPVVRGQQAGFLADALLAGADFLAREGLVSLYVRLHPLLNEVPRGVPTVVRHGDTVWIDLAGSDEEAWGRLRRDHRSQIARARRSGQRVILEAGPEHEASFRRLYRETMERVDAEPSYLFDERYFSELRDVLRDRLNLVVVEIDGVIAAAGLFVATQGIVQYFLSGSDHRFRRQAPTKLMIDEMGRWARQHGHRWLSLGGGLGFANDRLFEFKAGFSDLHLPFHSLRMILLPSEYEQHVRARGEAGPIPRPSTGFFPAYRAPADAGATRAARQPAAGSPPR